VGALATAEACRLHRDAAPVLGGVTWERRPIDAEPGPRSAEEIENARPLAPSVLAATGETHVRASGVRFAESRLAGLLGEETLLIDVNRGPATIANGLAAAIAELGCDLAVFIDVGGDALAHGTDPGLASPLCDAVMVAAAARLGRMDGPAILGGIFGIGCDGELTPDEVMARLEEVAAGGGSPPPARLTPDVVDRMEEAVRAVPTEASAMALRAYHGETGERTIRSGRRTVHLTPLAANTYYFDLEAALRSAARLAAAVQDAADLEEANEILHGFGIRTELDYERDAPHTSPEG
jgi:hypothetical protein